MDPMQPTRSGGVWAALWDGFVRTNGSVIGIAGMGVALIAWRWGAGLEIPLWVFLSACVVLLVIVVSLAQALRVEVTRSGITHVVIAVRAPYPPYTDAKCVCVVRPGTPLPVTTSVAFFRAHKGVEQPVGIGTVQHVQADQSVQATLDRVYPGLDDYVDDLARGVKSAIDELRVAAGVSLAHMATLLPQTKGEAVAGPPEATTPDRRTRP